MKKLVFFAFCFVLGLTSIGQTYFLNGNAVATGNDCYQLTSSGGNQNGTVWYANQINLVEDFDITFKMYLGNQDANGADGICFVLQNIGTNAIGVSGGGMGYQSFTTSLGIEFDTWQNTDSGDPSYDHIAIEKNGVVNHNLAENIAGPVQMDALDVNTEDNTDHVVQIKWDASAKLIQVYFDCVFRLQATIDISNEIFNGQSYVYWGFTAATGGAVNTHRVCLEPDILASAENVQACPGTSVQINAGPSQTGVYNWTPPATLSDPTIVNPIATPDTTTTYSVSFTNLCGIVQTSTITINVEPLVIDVPSSALLQCADTLATVNTTSNFTSLHYNWTTLDGVILGIDTLSLMNTNQAGTYIVEANYNNQCFDSDTVIVDADYSDFVLSVNYDSLLTCYDPTLTFSASSSIPGTQYLWTTNGGQINMNPAQANITIANVGSYTVGAYYNANCNDTHTITVTADQNIPVLTPSNDNTITCFDPTLTMIVNSNAPNMTYDWGPNINNPPAQNNWAVTSAGNYSVTATNTDNGCSAIQNFTIGIDTISPNVIWGTPDSISCLHPVEILDMYQVDLPTWNATWSTNEGSFVGLDPNVLYPEVNATGIYYLTVQNPDNGCIRSSEVFVPENNNIHFDVSQLSFPNIISMNQDGLNDEWRPFLADDLSQDVRAYFSTYDLKVYNRWGGIQFDSSDATPYWTPTDVSEGTYYYLLTYVTTCGGGDEGKVDGFVSVNR
ncbi:MAG: hypothetical protein RL362_1107 [Bacteroidota bacterium]